MRIEMDKTILHCFVCLEVGGGEGRGRGRMGEVVVEG